MEFRDLKKQYKMLKKDIDYAIDEVLEDVNFISGKQVIDLEEELAEYVGVKHCISCANGTDALSLVLIAWNIGPGDAVFVPDFTFFASGEVVASSGATPIFVDVDADTFNIDVKKLEKEIDRVKSGGELEPRVIIAVDLFGQPADYVALERLAKRHHILILEDAAQGFGGMLGKRKACSFGDASTTSFFPAKPLGCYGDGGAIFVNDDELAQKLNSLKNHGKGCYKYDNVRIGVNSRLDTLQAAILRVKFKAFKDFELLNINKIAAQYTLGLKNVVKTPEIKKNHMSSWAQYTIKLENKHQRDELQRYLKGKSIPTMIYYPKPMHKQKAFVSYEECAEDLCVTEALCEQVLALPLDPYMDENDINMVICEIKNYLGGKTQ